MKHVVQRIIGHADRRGISACPRSGWLAIVTAMALVLGCAGGESPAPAVDWEVPEVDTADMQAPVADAIRTARHAVEETKSNPDHWGQLGSVLYAHKLYDPAVVCFQRARQLAPDNFRSAYLLALTEDARGAEADEIVALFETAIGIEDRYPPAFQRYGDALVRVGRMEAARDAYRKVTEMDPQLAIAHRTLGQTLLQLGEVEEAVTHLERAVALRPEDSIVHASLAQAFNRLGDRTRADEAARRAGLYTPVTSFPDIIGFETESLAMDSISLRDRVNAKMSGGSYAEAIPDLEVLIEMFPDSAQMRAQMGSCYHRTNQPELAIEQLEKAVELEPRLLNAHLLLADVYHSAGKLELAREHYGAVLEQDPAHEGIFAKRALAMAIQGDLAAAAVEFARHGDLTTPDAEIHHNWGTVLLRSGDFEGAVEHFEASLASNPDHPESIYNLGVSLGKLGRTDEAIETLERVVSMGANQGGRVGALANAARGEISNLREGVSSP